ncbi:MAG TPA: flavin reductase family protein [Dehalococcoidia bacterium]
MTVDPIEFRSVIGHLATGVTVITTAAGDELQGMTANAVTSLSLDPVMVLICVDKTTHTHRMLEAGGVFVVNVLGKHQEDVSRLFAKRVEPERGTLRGQPFRFGETGAPILDDCLAFLECRVADVLNGGDHSIFLGEVVNEAVVDDVEPLIFFRGTYHVISERP